MYLYIHITYIYKQEASMQETSGNRTLTCLAKATMEVEARHQPGAQRVIFPWPPLQPNTTPK